MKFTRKKEKKKDEDFLKKDYSLILTILCRLLPRNLIKVSPKNNSRRIREKTLMAIKNGIIDLREESSILSSRSVNCYIPFPSFCGISIRIRILEIRICISTRRIIPDTSALRDR